MKINKIPAGLDVPRRIDAVIESPRGSRIRYAYDAEIDAFRFFAELEGDQGYPAAYGFVPSTMSLDGEPLDVLILSSEPTFTGCVVSCRPVAVLVLTDGNRPDHKILAIPTRSVRYADVEDFDDLPEGIADELAEFFSAHPNLSGFEQEVVGWEGADSARDVVFKAWEGFLI
ncbi:MAG: inorganic diphosphatase [Planctomycetota bacterium]|jgi:inorganic pyrophosphatase